MNTLTHIGAEDLLKIVMRGCERLSTVVTSDRSVQYWDKLLGNLAAVASCSIVYSFTVPHAECAAHAVAHTPEL
jgi:hypothetical protein